MLKVIGHKPCEDAWSEFGPHAPFAICTRAERARPSFYWRTGDLKATLLELEVSPDDGQIIAATLLLPGVVATEFPLMDLPADVVDGMAVVQTEGWPGDRILDEPGSFSVYVRESSVLILFSASAPVRRYVTGDISIACCDDGALAWILVANARGEYVYE